MSVDIITPPVTPGAFLATVETIITNVTGAGTLYTIVYDTERFDEGADFSSTTFTAPATGTYLLIFSVRIAGLTGATDSILLGIATSNKNYTNFYIAETNGFGSDHTLSLSVIADMDINDTASTQIVVSGEATDVVDIFGGASPITMFSGRRVS